MSFSQLFKKPAHGVTCYEVFENDQEREHYDEGYIVGLASLDYKCHFVHYYPAAYSYKPSERQDVLDPQCHAGRKAKCYYEKDIGVPNVQNSQEAYSAQMQNLDDQHMPNDPRFQDPEIYIPHPEDQDAQNLDLEDELDPGQLIAPSIDNRPEMNPGRWVQALERVPVDIHARQNYVQESWPQPPEFVAGQPWPETGNEEASNAVAPIGNERKKRSS